MFKFHMGMILVGLPRRGHRSIKRQAAVFMSVLAVVTPNGLAGEEAALGDAEAAGSRSYEVIDSYEADLGDHKIIFHWVKPPAARVKPVVASMPAEPSSEVLAQIEAQRAGEHQSLLLTGTVYDREVTELKWSYGGRSYRAFSNVDFDHLCCNFELLTIEEGDRVYKITKVIDSESTETRAMINRARLEQGQPALPAKWIPSPEDFPLGRSAFLLVDRGARGNDEAAPTDDEIRAACAGIEAIHRYYDANKDELIAKWRERLAAQEAASTQAAQREPKPKEDTVIYFWREPREDANPPAAGSNSGEGE